MPQEEEQEVVVVGKRLKLGEPDKDWGGLGPAPWVTTLNSSGASGGPLVETTQMLDETGPKRFEFEDFGFVVEIPAEDWARMTPAQKQTITYILTHYQNSPTLTAALQHMSNEGVSIIEIRMDTVAHLFDGTTRPFGLSHSSGQPVAAAISYNYTNTEQTEIVDGSKVVISFNSNFATNMDTFSRYFIHELLHPYIPDLNGDDEMRPGGVVQSTERVIDEMMPDGPGGESIMNVPNLTGLGGTASLGTASGDQLGGSVNDDFLAGMEGNDVLNGISGNDTLSGGYGLDTLSAGAGTSLLLGGFDADTYIAGGYGTFFTVDDTGGVDRLRLPGSSGNVTVQRYQDDLILSSVTGAYSITVANHYLSASRVEVFEFDNGSFAASHIEALVPQQPTTCYDERGVLVPCDEFLAPVILDLKGDGVAFSKALRSKAWFDVDQDGVMDRVSWIKGKDDAILVFDRNGNGKVDGASEISFLDDLAGARSDMEGLLGLDSNRDGFLTAADDSFNDFMLWRDRNGNGVSEKKELISLEQAGVTSIGLEILDRRELDGGREASQVLGRSTVTFADGSEIDAYDVALDTRISRSPVCGCSGSNDAPFIVDIFSLL